MDRLFGYRLRDLRVEKELTGSQLAAMVGTSKGTVAHWEAGDYYPNNDKMVLLADSLGVTIDYLMGRTSCKKSISVLTASGEQIVDLKEFTPDQQELIRSMIKQFNK